MPRQSYLGEFEFMVLLAAIRLGDDAYGVPIAREIEQRSRREVALGSVYAALERLEEKGLVTSRLGDPTAARGGRARRRLSRPPYRPRARRSSTRFPFPPSARRRHG